MSTDIKQRIHDAQDALNRVVEGVDRDDRKSAAQGAQDLGKAADEIEKGLKAGERTKRDDLIERNTHETGGSAPAVTGETAGTADVSTSATDASTKPSRSRKAAAPRKRTTAAKKAAPKK